MATTFDASAYRRRVLSSLAGGERDLRDAFALVDLDPTIDDDRLIQARIDEVVAFWQKERNSPRYRAVIADLLANREAMTAILTDRGRRTELRRQVMAERVEAGAARSARLVAMLDRLDARFGGVPSSRVDPLRRVARREGLNEEEFAACLAGRRILSDGARGAEPLPAPVRRQIRDALAELGRLGARVAPSGAPAAPRTLFDFLGVAADAAPGQLAARHAALLTQNRRRRHDRHQTLVDELLALAKLHLMDGDPGRYLASLAADVGDRLRSEVEAAMVVDDRLTPLEFERLVRSAVADGLDQKTARATVIALANELDVPVEVTTPVDYVTCPACAAVEVADQRRRACRSCGAALYRDCPKCAANVEAAAATCPKCRFDMRARQEAEAELELAQAARAAGLLAEARFRAEQAVALDATLTGAGQLQAELERAHRAASDQWRSVERALATGRPYDAAELLARLARDARDVLGPGGLRLADARVRAEAGMEAARQAVAEAGRLAGADRERALLDLLARVPDCQEALDALRRIPVAAPRRVSAVVTPTSVRVVWQPSASPGKVEYRVARASGGEERPVGVTRRCELEDAGVPPGAVVSYTVVASRSGIGSGTSRTKPVLVAREVEGLIAVDGDGMVSLRWRFPPAAGTVWVERTEVGRPRAPVRRFRADDQQLVDREVDNGSAYQYRVLVEYRPGQDEVFRTAGRVVTGRPAAPPAPVAGLTAESDGREVRLAWPPVPAGVVQVYRTEQAPERAPGSLLHAGGVDRLGTRLPMAGGRAVDRVRGGLRWYLPVTVVGDQAVLGPALRHTGLGDVTGLVTADADADVLLRWAWPEGCTEVLVSWRRDRYPAGPDDPGAQRAKTTNSVYELKRGWRLTAAGGEQPYHFCLFPGRRVGGQLVWNEQAGPGGRRTHPGRRVGQVAWSLARVGWRRRTLRVTFHPRSAPPDPPLELVIVASTGLAPPLGPGDGLVLGRAAAPSGPGGEEVAIEVPLADLRLPATIGVFVADERRRHAVAVVAPALEERVVR